jgi:small-conductance mechanosensitive channel
MPAPADKPPVGDAKKPDSTASLQAQETAVLRHLNDMLTWFRSVRETDGWATLPTDEFYRDNQHDYTNQAVTSAFAYARGMANVIESEGENSGGGQDSREVRLAARIATNSERLAKLKDEEMSLEAQSRDASVKVSAGIQAKISLVQSEVALDSAVGEALSKAVSVVESSGGGAGESLSSKISALQKTVTGVFDSTGSASKKSPAPVIAHSSGGLVNRTVELFSLMEHRHSVDQMLVANKRLQSDADRLSQPLGARIRSTIQQGDKAGTEASGTADPAALRGTARQISQLAALVSHLSAAIIPLRAESAALDQSASNLAEWRTDMTGETDSILRGLFTRSITLAVVLAALVLFSELWRRATFKYVHDARRRRQFLLIRRFATASLMVLVLVMGFVSNFSSIATFAGFITAGIAVALQTIILSVAAYFFLIGRYGVKVGDRVTVSGVTGEVIDIGLVRVFLMELAGTGVDLHPTGRVVVLANSALFSTTPLYKQLPGTHFAWHEIYVTVNNDADRAPLEKAMLQAVEKVYGSYRSSIEQQHGNLQRLLDYETELPVPKVQVRLADTGVEVVVRYPADLRTMSEVDEAVAGSVIEMLTRDEALRKLVSGPPKIRSAVKS